MCQTKTPRGVAKIGLCSAGSVIAFIEAAAVLTLLMVGQPPILFVVMLHIALRIARQSRVSVLRRQLGEQGQEQTNARETLKVAALAAQWLAPLTALADTATIAVCIYALATVNTFDWLWRQDSFDDGNKSLLGSAG